MRVVACALALLLLVACSDGSDPAADAAGASEVATLPPLEATEPGGQAITFEQLELGLVPPGEGQELVLRVYDAPDPHRRARGLMGVETLPERTGMLFRFPKSQQGGFWMKNTVLPLSIAYADSRGLIVDILDMEPCTADPCEVYTPDAPYQYALEVPRGAFESWDVAEGWTLAVPKDVAPAT